MQEQLFNIEQPKTDNNKSNSDLICELYGLGAGEGYDIVYADPPWEYKSKGMYQETFPKRKQTRRYQGVNDQYKTLGIDQLKNLEVKKIVAKNCALFLWAVDSHLPEALELIKAWGFKYRSIAFIWVKRSSKNKLCANVGAWTMKNAEICLIATRGNMAKYKEANNVYQIIEAERTKHSKKPNEARNRIETIFGDKRRIELFAREKFYGWDVWGDQAPKSV